MMTVDHCFSLRFWPPTGPRLQ